MRNRKFVLAKFKDNQSYRAKYDDTPVVNQKHAPQQRAVPIEMLRYTIAFYQHAASANGVQGRNVVKILLHAL